MINNSDAHYTEIYEFKKFEGMDLLPPYSGSTLNLKCGPGETKAAIIRVEARGYSLSYVTYDQII